MNSQQLTSEFPLPVGEGKGEGLQPGTIISLPSSGLAEVLSVNEFRVHVRSLNKRHVEINTAFEGDKHFVASGREWDISPNSEVEILEVGSRKSEVGNSPTTNNQQTTTD